MWSGAAVFADPGQGVSTDRDRGCPWPAILTRKPPRARPKGHK